MYTVYPTKLAALQANMAAAFNAGMNMETTVYLYARIDHPTDGRSALADGTGPVTHEQLVAEGFLEQTGLVGN